MAQSRKGGSNGSNGPMSMAAGSTRDGTSLHRACAAPAPLSLFLSIDVLDAMRAAGWGWDEITACRATGPATNTPVRCLLDLSVQSNRDSTSQGAESGSGVNRAQSPPANGSSQEGVVPSRA